MELLQSIDMNEYAIELIDEKQSSYEPIYALSLIKLETLKAYIETHLKTGFIQSSKSLAGTPILFNKKSDSSFCLYVNN